MYLICIDLLCCFHVCYDVHQNQDIVSVCGEGGGGGGGRAKGLIFVVDGCPHSVIIINYLLILF